VTEDEYVISEYNIMNILPLLKIYFDALLWVG